MDALGEMLCRIGDEQEDKGGQPFPFMCADNERELVEELLDLMLVHQQTTGPAISEFIEGFTSFNGLSLTNSGRSEWKRLKSTR